MAVRFVERKNTNCNKWDNLQAMFGENDLQAMWVADMDFAVPDCVISAINDYLKLGVFGYYKPADSYYEAFINWERQHHSYAVRREWLRFSPGVVPAFNWLIQILTQPRDAVIVQTPVYYPFLDAIKNNGRKLICSDLINTDGIYTIDFADFERKIEENDVKLFILSSPHNPVGRVWTRDELQKLLDICKARGVFVISDEIHHDMIFGENEHIPSATVGDYDDVLVTLTAATKTFNLAGCQNSFVIIPNAELRAAYDVFIEKIRIRGGSSFGYIAVEAAYRGGEDWLIEVREIIRGNYLHVKKRLAAALPKAVVSPLEGTYLLWIDLGAYVPAEQIKDVMQKKCRLALDYGEWFGGKRFATHVRMNLATSRNLVEQAVENIIQALS